MKYITITRQDLYDLVWKESMLSLSKKYAISGNGLKKKCKALRIPFPGLGYWAKLQFGKSGGKIPPLRPFKDGQLVTLYLREPNNPTYESRRNMAKQLVADESLVMTIPEELVNPDKLVMAVKEDIYKRKVWKKTDELVYNSSGFLNITVFPENLKRALIFMDRLIKVLKKRGHSVTVENNTTYFILFGERIPICCREKLAKTFIEEGSDIGSDYEPTGLLSIKIEGTYYSRTWTEGRRSLEQLLPKIIIDLEVIGRKLKEERLERERKQAEQREKERIARETQERKEKELKNFLKILKNAKRHDNSEKIRQYADELERFSTEKGSLTDNIKDQIAWMRKKADWYDPFIEAEDEWMMGIDRDKLKLEKKSYYWWDR